MLNIHLLAEDIRENRKRWLSFTGILCFLMLLFVMTAYPLGGSRMETVFRFFPGWFKRLLRMELNDRSLVGVLGTYLYSFWFLLIPMIYTVQAAHELVLAGMESGMMIFYVGSPMGRETVIFTKGYSLMFGQFCMICFSTVLGIALSEIMIPGELEIPQFLLLNICVFCLHFALGGLEFLLSTMNLGSSLQRGLMAGIPALAFVLYLLGNLGGVMEIFGYFSMFSIFDTERIFGGDFSLFFFLPLLLMFGCVCYGMSVFIFNRKDLKFGK